MPSTVPSTMAQNIYDDAQFFKTYSAFPRMVKGIRGASEWPQLRRMLPSSLTGKNVLDLGCGDAWFGRWALGHGAGSVHGCDISQNMLARAKAMSAEYPELTFSKMDLEDVSLEDGAYDVVFSGLAIHYVSNLQTLLNRVYNSLSPGGVFVFSIEHPFLTASLHPGFRSYPEVESDDERDYWTVDHYFAEGPRDVNWCKKTVRKIHRTQATYINMLLRVGFEIKDLDEWGSTEQTVAAANGNNNNNNNGSGSGSSNGNKDKNGRHKQEQPSAVNVMVSVSLHESPSGLVVAEKTLQTPPEATVTEVASVNCNSDGEEEESEDKEEEEEEEQEEQNRREDRKHPDWIEGVTPRFLVLGVAKPVRG